MPVVTDQDAYAEEQREMSRRPPVGIVVGLLAVVAVASGITVCRALKGLRCAVSHLLLLSSLLRPWCVFVHRSTVYVGLHPLKLQHTPATGWHPLPLCRRQLPR